MTIRDNLDNRMLWIRILERLSDHRPTLVVDLEVASEARIVGTVNYCDSTIWIAPFTFDPDSTGRYKYLIRIPVPPQDEPDERLNAERRGYAFREGVQGELTALLSLFLESPFLIYSLFCYF